MKFMVRMRKPPAVDRTGMVKFVQNAPSLGIDHEFPAVQDIRIKGDFPGQDRFVFVPVFMKNDKPRLRLFAAREPHFLDREVLDRADFFF